jgi:hypothetical protein
LKITISKAGGFAGLKPEEVATVDTNQLAPGAADAVRGIIDTLFEPREQEIGTDLYRYTVTVSDDPGRSREITIDVSGEPTGPLLDLFNTLGVGG